MAKSKMAHRVIDAGMRRIRDRVLQSRVDKYFIPDGLKEQFRADYLVVWTSRRDDGTYQVIVSDDDRNTDLLELIVEITDSARYVSAFALDYFGRMPGNEIQSEVHVPSDKYPSQELAGCARTAAETFHWGRIISKTKTSI